jgi:hypothetical protein
MGRSVSPGSKVEVSGTAPVARGGLSATLVGGTKVVVFGGEDGGAGAPGCHHTWVSVSHCR